MKKRRFWVPALLLLLALAAVFGGAAGRKIRAKSKLAAALSQVFSQLEDRFQNDPLGILLECYDPDGQYAVDLEAATSQDMLGTVTYKMTVNGDLKAHRFSAEGVAQTPREAIDLSLYLDPDFMAVSSDTLVAGAYYGITYDTFAADLRKIPMLDFIVNDGVLSRWDASVQTIRQLVCREYPIPQIPQLGEGELVKLLLGVAAMPCQLQSADIVMGERTLSCTQLDYAISGEQVAWAMSALTGESYDSGSSFLFSFYLCGDGLVRFTISGITGETPFRYCVDLNQNPLQDPLTLTGSYGSEKSLSVTVSTEQRDSRYEESWNIRTVGEGEERDCSFALNWNLQTGALTFRSPQLAAPVTVNFQKTENGLRLETQDLRSLLDPLFFLDTVPSVARSKIPGVLTIAKGTPIDTPAYKNLDQWSMQDFLTMLAGAGTLIGIRLE